MSDTDPYAILGLSPGASDEDVKKQYRKLAMENHPDRNPGNAEAEARFKAVTDANDRIKKGWKPGQQQGGFGFAQPGAPFGFGSPFGNVDDIFAAFHAQHRQQNRDVETQAVISLEDAFTGVDATINLNVANAPMRQVKVHIPAGSDNGTRIRVPQAGDTSFSALKPGDLYLSIRIAPHARFKRAGDVLIANMAVDVFDLMLGGTIHLNSIEGREIAVNIPAGSQPNQQIRLEGMGMPDLQSGKRGDLFIIPEVSIPALTDDQRRQLAAVRSVT